MDNGNTYGKWYMKEFKRRLNKLDLLTSKLQETYEYKLTSNSDYLIMSNNLKAFTKNEGTSII